MKSLSEDWRSAQLDERLHAILGFAEKLTLRPQEVRREDHAPDGLGVSLEEGYR